MDKKKLTNRKIRDTSEPVSAFSPIVFTRRVGIRDRTRTTGDRVVSCRKLVRDVTRYDSRDDSRNGRNGRYAERNRRPSVTAGRPR